MKVFSKIALSVALVGALVCSSSLAYRKEPLEMLAQAAYTTAKDVDYVVVDGKVANWGTRGEDCVFLSSYAEDFYGQKSSYSYQTLSQKSGGSSQSNAPQSALYNALSSMMKSEHDHQTSYGETRDLYCYTDCINNNYNNISSFYSGKTLSGAWDGGKTWNREHTWPNSKGLGGNDENDIMMLRPTWVQENSSRGNKAYGEGEAYFNPDCENPPASVKGDCARIVLYVYTRWGNTSYMWGTSGVMESVSVLLKWMEEDPVDTWEMGRNDAVQSITGTRNVFIDYPEYAWQLFGESVPKVVTPSGIAAGKEQTPPEDSSTGDNSSSEEQAPPVNSSTGDNSSSEGQTPPVNSSTGDSSSSEGQTPPVNSSTGDSSSSEEQAPPVDSGAVENSGETPTDSTQECVHEFGKWFVITAPTESVDGLQQRFCKKCGYTMKETISFSAESNAGEGSSMEESVAQEEIANAGCAGSIYGAVSGAFLVAVCGGVLLKRKREE